MQPDLLPLLSSGLPLLLSNLPLLSSVGGGRWRVGCGGEREGESEREAESEREREGESESDGGCELDRRAGSELDQLGWQAGSE